MAVSSCDDLPSTADNNLDIMYDRDAAEQMEASHACKLACVFCGTAATDSTQHLKVLPCLHITCQPCLTRCLSDTSPANKDDNFAASIFSCPRCSYTAQLPCDLSLIHI